MILCKTPTSFYLETGGSDRSYYEVETSLLYEAETSVGIPTYS